MLKANKAHWGLIVVLIVVAIFGSGIVRDMLTEQETNRIEELLAPAIAQSLNGVPDPKPVLAFVVPTKKSILVVVRWDQTPTFEVKNHLREKILETSRRTLVMDPKLWGRHVSVSFLDEVVSQGFK